MKYLFDFNLFFYRIPCDHKNSTHNGMEIFKLILKIFCIESTVLIHLGCSLILIKLVLPSLGLNQGSLDDLVYYNNLTYKVHSRSSLLSFTDIFIYILTNSLLKNHNLSVASFLCLEGLFWRYFSKETCQHKTVPKDSP